MLIYGQKPRSEDPDEVIAQLHANQPSTFYASGEAWPAAPAHHVVQGQVGFSTTDPLVTKHIGQGVVLALRSSANGKIALAHIDELTSPESIAAVFDQMGKGPLLAIMAGAHDPADIARHILAKVLHAMHDRNINVIAARLRDGKPGDTLYVDPQNFVARRAASEYPHADRKTIRIGGMDSIPLEVTCNLGPLPQQLPIPFRTDEAGSRIYDQLRAAKGFNVDADPKPISCIKNKCKAAISVPVIEPKRPKSEAPCLGG